ncbi:MAG: ParB/RepB/Spo0J family partition protein [Synechococcales cyanobacterium K44_A2020_017]|nr:ParB/RepB/Spo0J family partition protein [Synechococcales cyanobacterium K44_A2020_017]
MPRRKSLKDEWQFEDVEETPLDKQSLSIDSITLPTSQPRRYFDPEKLQQLTESVRQHGILEPILVRPLKENQYELVAGERRFRAAQAVGLSSVPVTIRELSDESALQLALVENLQREDLNPIEETEGVLQLLALRMNIPVLDVPPLLYRMRNEVIGNANQNVLISEEAQAVQTIFAELGTISWESFATSRLSLLRLPPEVLDTLRSGKIAYTKAQAIARVKDDNQRKSILEQAITQDLSLKEIKALIQESKPVVEIEDTPEQMLVVRMADIAKRLKKSKAWTQKKKRDRITKLLNEREQYAEEV